MAFEIVDGMTGTKHISSDDLSALNVATIGKADCVLKYGDDFALTMQSANSAALGTGVGMVGGKRFWNQAATSLTVQSGTQGQKRNDLVVARYAKTSAGIESITPVVIKGTPTTGTAADPEATANDLKLWRVPLDGISVGEPVKLFEPVASLAAIGDSVSPMVVAQTSTGKLYQPFRCDLPSDRMAALVCVYDNGRPLASTVFPISIFAQYCTGPGVCADCYYSPGGFGVHAYYTGGMLNLMADAGMYRAVFVVL
ncbi:MAG: hypothetical protein U0N89_07165 [Collinsella intestinalis]